jgi:hypothetical protein
VKVNGLVESLEMGLVAGGLLLLGEWSLGGLSDADVGIVAGMERNRGVVVMIGGNGS